MKIAVVGCGAVGSFYGAKLCRVDQEVHFLLRSDFQVVRRQGVHVFSVDGDFHAYPRCAATPASIGPSDVVLIALKTTANDQFPALLPPLIGLQTALVTLQNGLGNEAPLAAWFGPEKVLGGLCFVCLNRTAPGVIHHTAHGRVVLGEYQRPIGERTRALAGLFQQAGLPCDLADDLECAHWEKLIWNIPFNGLGVAGAAGYEAVCRGALSSEASVGPCLTTDRLLGDPRWETLVRELMLEVILIARTLGYPLPQGLVQENVERTQIMGAYKASTLLDFERGRPLELDSLFLEPLRWAQKAGVAAPRLAALCSVLQQLNYRLPL